MFSFQAAWRKFVNYGMDFEAFWICINEISSMIIFYKCISAVLW